MKQRGRVGSSALEILKTSPIEVIGRQPAPHDLTDEETEVWVSIVNHESADSFDPSSAPLLAQYCRHTVAARKVAELILKAESSTDLTITDRQRLYSMQAQESKTLCSLATKLRISQQSITNHRGNKKTGDKKPWEG